jgi:hypothetical protein
MNNVAEAAQFGDEALCGAFLAGSVEVVRMAAQVQWIRTVFSHSGPSRIRLERRLPALSSLRDRASGHMTHAGGDGGISLA